MNSVTRPQLLTHDEQPVPLRYLDRVPTMKQWIIPLGMALLSMLGSGYANYTKTDKDTDRRITVVETQRTEDIKRLERIEDKIDRLIERSAR